MRVFASDTTACGKLLLACLLLAGYLLSGAGCRAHLPAPEPLAAPDLRTVSLERLAPSDYPPFCDDLAYDGLAQALAQSLVYLDRRPDQQTLSYGDDVVAVATLRHALHDFMELLETQPSCADLQDHIRQHYVVYQSPEQASGRPVRFTGYYEPLLAGGYQATRRYRYPVYARPPDLVTVPLGDFNVSGPTNTVIGRLENQTLRPYHSRHTIEAGALPPDTPVLAWVDDPLSLFFLHIQGSGRIRMEDGRMLRVGYDVANGHPYRSIGRLLIDEGHIAAADMSMQQIKAYLRANPHDRQRVLEHNPSYVFFRTITGGPFGNINVSLTAGRSLALDYRLFPAAALMYIETRIPHLDGHGQIQSWQPLQRFVMHQDTGGAIRGPQRADLFLGSGVYAEISAGHLQHEGRMYFLRLKAPETEMQK